MIHISFIPRPPLELLPYAGIEIWVLLIYCCTLLLCLHVKQTNARRAIDSRERIVSDIAYNRNECWLLWWYVSPRAERQNTWYLFRYLLASSVKRIDRRRRALTSSLWMWCYTLDRCRPLPSHLLHWTAPAIRTLPKHTACSVKVLSVRLQYRLAVSIMNLPNVP